MELKGLIKSNKTLTKLRDVFQLKVELDKDFEFKPGQFVNVYCANMLLPRPISIADKDGMTITLLIKIVGEGTDYLSNTKSGESIKLVGPLGKGFSTKGKQDSKVAIIGGGIGVAPILGLGKSKFKTAQYYLGFNDEGILLDEFKRRYPTNVAYLAKGANVLEAFENGLATEKYDFVYGCGPEGMLQGLQGILIKNNIPGELSVEKKMACGVGGCLICTCETTRGKLRVCKEGPVFDSREVLFNE